MHRTRFLFHSAASGVRVVLSAVVLAGVSSEAFKKFKLHEERSKSPTPVLTLRSPAVLALSAYPVVPIFFAAGATEVGRVTANFITRAPKLEAKQVDRAWQRPLLVKAAHTAVILLKAADDVVIDLFIIGDGVPALCFSGSSFGSSMSAMASVLGDHL